ncbi:hypothetical protein JCM6882_002868 [Rhodosporidiobolus microsporus]
MTGASGGSSSGAGQPDSFSFRGGPANAYWGMEVLPPNASLGAFSQGGGSSLGPGESHFFQPGASAFSFEAGPSGSLWDGSYRSSVVGSPSIFDDGRPSILHRSSTQDSSPLNPRAASGSGSGSGGSNIHPPVQLWDLPSSGSARSTGSSVHRTSSPMGGGRKPKEASRGLRFPVATVSRDKGLVGLAKPPKEAEQGRVAVAGKTCLKILKVPYGPSSRLPSAPPSVAPTPSSSYRSSIAYRRSRSRGSPAPLDRAREAEGYVGRESGGGVGGDGEREGGQKEEVSEVMDVRLGSRLGPAFLFSDVSWGFGGTSNKLATSFTNGAVVLWDLAKEGGSRLDQLKYEHDRAVNRVVFGGQTGNWLMSGGQDGQMKLWDIRDSRPANMILKAASPVRHLSFSPSASQPFTLLAACASGTLIRYDVRYISRQNGGATDRIAGHIGACLAMDWRDGFSCERPIPGAAGGVTVGATAETAGGGREGGWVVTGGIDKTIKIWDFSLPTLATKPVRTLYTSQAVHAVAWHPSRATELVSSPLPSLGSSGVDGGGGASSGGADDSAPPTTPVTPGEPLSGTLMKRDGHARGAGAGEEARLAAWKNEIEVWDVRRPYFPKLAIKTEEPTSALLFNDDDTVWSTSKASATFLQHDVASDSYALLDSIDRPAPAWSLEGELAFVDDGRRATDVPFERPSREMPPVNTPKFRPEIFLNTIGNIDPDFSIDSFAYLANNLRLTGDFSEVCEHNAQACLYADRSDASQVWMTLRTWFDSEPLFPPDSPPPPPPVGTAKLPDAALNFADWILSPTSATGAEAATKKGRPPHSGRPSFSSIRNSRRSSADTTPLVTSLGAGSAQHDQQKAPLDAFSEESTADEHEETYHPSDYHEHTLDSTSSDSEHEMIAPDSEHEMIARQRKLNALNSNRLAASLAALRPRSKEGRRSRSSTGDSVVIADDETDTRGSNVPSRFQSRRNSSSTSSGSDLDEEDEERAKPSRSGSVRRSRSQKIASMHASLIANRSRRPSAGAGASLERRPLRSREGTGSRVSSRQQSVDAVSMSRRGSLPFSAARISRLNSSDLTGGGGSELLLATRNISVAKGTTSEELYRKEGVKHAAEAFEVVKSQLLATLQEYADRGDSQLCATVCCVLRDKDVDFDSLWVARVTKTYLDLLRHFKLHIPAATLNKYCTTESLRGLTQNTVVFHTSCGTCGKSIESSPFAYCAKCSSQVTKCCFCHLVVGSLYVFCAACGHGAHADCLNSFASTIANSLATVSQPQTPLDMSHPSTPGIGTPLRAWMWGEGDDAGVSSPLREGGGIDFGALAEQNLRRLASSCPAACGHNPCLLISAVA